MIKSTPYSAKASTHAYACTPPARFAYTLGQGASLNVFDLERQEMLAVVDVPGGAGIQVQDVAISQDGNTLYAIATINQNDTIFATARINAENFTWQPVTMICDIKLVTLGTAFSLAKDQVYAIGEQKGLYLLNPNNLPADPQPLVAFAAGRPPEDQRESEARLRHRQQHGHPEL